MNPLDPEREAQRQRLLMQALQQGDAALLHGWACVAEGAAHDLQRGLGAYRVNAAATAARALAARYPTVQQWLGAEAFAALSRRLWQVQPPQRGDLAQWGDGLPGFIARDGQLTDEVALADCARLDALVAAAEGAADVEPDPASLHLLASVDAALLRCRAAPGAALLHSSHPVVTLWQAHHDPAVQALPDPFAAARQALAEGRSEIAWVWRQDWQVRVQAVPATTAHFMQQALLERLPLQQALEQAGAGLDFEAWLIEALQQGWLPGIDPLVDPS
ncbi:MAG: hypothetical protein RJA44_1765 [Pseudomonadota bacterium]